MEGQGKIGWILPLLEAGSRGKGYTIEGHEEKGKIYGLEPGFSERRRIA